MTNLSASCFELRGLHTHSMFLTSSLKTCEIRRTRFNCTCFSRSSGNRVSTELMRMSSARVCAFPWASRRPQLRLTRSSILSMAPINSGSFTHDGDEISLRETSRSSRSVWDPPSVQLAPALEVMVTFCCHHNVTSATELRAQHSEPSTHSPAVANARTASSVIGTESDPTSESRVQGERVSTSQLSLTTRDTFR